ncbi:hypothetical protein NPF69_004579 [Salmonella enterica]|nr:hypothetical protein [Salmonella enterica]
MNKITSDVKGISSLKSAWETKKDMSNECFKNLLTTKINKNETRNSGVHPLTSGTLNSIMELFTHQIKQLNIQKKESVNISNLTKEQQYIIDDMGKILKNKVLYSIKANEFLNEIDFKKSHFIKI